jgi:hypothetical protein
MQTAPKLKPPPRGVVLTVNRSALYPLHETAAIRIGSIVKVPSFGFEDWAKFEVLDLGDERAKIRAT